MTWLVCSTSKYMQKLSDNIISDQLSKRQEYFLLGIDITSLLADKRELQAIMTNPNTLVRDMLDAINSDIQLNITLMRLEYEGSLFIENYKRSVLLRKTDTIDQGILKP
jgi:hypothetical protein